MIDPNQLLKYLKPASVEEGQIEDHEEPKIIYLHPYNYEIISKMILFP